MKIISKYQYEFDPAKYAEDYEDVVSETVPNMAFTLSELWAMHVAGTLPNMSNPEPLYEDYDKDNGIYENDDLEPIADKADGIAFYSGLKAKIEARRAYSQEINNNRLEWLGNLSQALNKVKEVDNEQVVSEPVSGDNNVR